MNPEQIRQNIVGKTYEYGHDKTGRMIRVTKVDGKEKKREFLNQRIVWPGQASVQPKSPEERTKIGVANFGIRKFKRSNPRPSHKEIQDFKIGSWNYPPAQLQIEMSAMPEKGKKK